MKIVKNTCYGGFSLSVQALIKIVELKGMHIDKIVKYLNGNEIDITNSLEKWESSNSFVITTDNGKTYGAYSFSDASERTDPELIKVVEELGEASYGEYARLEVVEIPDGIKWEIDDYDGVETIEEAHRKW